MCLILVSYRWQVLWLCTPRVRKVESLIYAIFSRTIAIRSDT